MDAIEKKDSGPTKAAFSDEKYQVYVLAKNIYKLKLQSNIELDANDAIEIRSNFLSLSNGKKWGVLVDAENFFSTTSEFRQLSASKEYTDLRLALAIVTNSMATKIIGNFFIKVNKPASPTKLFSDEKQAFEWLKRLLLSQQ
jgi:hypothetical protein